MVSLRSLDLTDAQEAALTRGLQLALAGLLGFGIVRGNAGIAVNAAGALVASLLPALVRRETGLRTDAGITLWITAAVFMHAVGILGPYRNIWWWDLLTHALSATVVVGVGYAVVRALDRHSDAVSVPEPFLSVFLFLFVVATGVLWELLEFAVTRVSQYFGRGSVLVVFGVGDIVTDLMFTTLGGLLVSFLGRGYFRGLSRKIARHLPHRTVE